MGAVGLLLDCLAGVLVSARGGGAEVGLVWLLGWDSVARLVDGVEVAVAAVWAVDVRREADGGQNRENNDFRSAMNDGKQHFTERRQTDYV